MSLSTILKALSRKKSFDTPSTTSGASSRTSARASSRTSSEHQQDSGQHLSRTLGLPSVIAIGLGCIIGTGIFVLTGKVALQHSGPSIMLSFLLSGIACLLAALCYAEFASLVPRSGSAYAYSYVTLGEFVAWLIGWDLILEYGLAIVTVASGWSSHLISIIATLSSFSWHADPQLGSAAAATAATVVAAATTTAAATQSSLALGSLSSFFPQEWINTPFDPILAQDPETPGKILRTPDGQPVISGYGIANLPAMAIIFLLCSLLLAGIKSSIRFNNVMVVMKLSIAIFFVGVGLLFVDPANWFPLIPEFTPTTEVIQGYGAKAENLPLWQVIGNALGYSFSSGFGGISGIFTGAAILFYAYLGFDAITTSAEEVKNPKRNLPWGILISVAISTVLYILMAAVFTGLVKADGSLSYEELGIFKGAPLAYAFSTVPVLNRYALLLIEIGGFLGITSVLLVLLYAQSRILFAISRDGLLPPIFSRVHPKTKIPSWSILMVGGLLGITAGFVPLVRVAELVNVGTLSAFFLVAFAILYLRRNPPKQTVRPMQTMQTSQPQFQIPWVPLIPILCMLVCFILMISLPFTAWSRFFIWMLVGIAIYGVYGRRHSHLKN